MVRFRVPEAFVRDIAERKKVEDKLIFQSNILSRVQDAIIATDKNFNIIYWNKIAEKMLGWTEEEALGRNSGELLRTKVEKSSREDVIEKVLKNGHFEGELYYSRKDGTYLPVELKIKISYDEEGEIIGLLTSVCDISERKNAELKIEQKQGVLDAINQVFQESLISETEKDVIIKCLEVAEKLTGSEFGFFGEVNENGRLDDRVLSPPALGCM